MVARRLQRRYDEAIDYFRTPESEASRLFEGDEYVFCRAYVREQYSDGSKRWDEDDHRRAYEAAREGADHVNHGEGAMPEV